MYTTQLTLDLITKEKQNELLKAHRDLLARHLKFKRKLHLKVRNKILLYYDTQISKDNIEDQYNKPLDLFLIHLLT